MRAILVTMILLTAATTAPDASDPKLAAIAFETAVNSGDAAGVKADCTGTAEQVAAAVAVADGALAEHQLFEAARAKFGDESAKLVAKAEYKPFDFPFDDPQLSVSTDTGVARLIVPSRVRPLMTLFFSDGKWRVDAGSILYLSRTPAALTAVEERSARVASELKDEIAAGQYASAEDAARAKADKILRAEGKIK